jgi:transposase-like protein
MEDCHRPLRQGTKTKPPCPTDAALVKMLYLAGPEAQRKRTRRVPNWGEILG